MRRATALAVLLLVAPAASQDATHRRVVEAGALRLGIPEGWREREVRGEERVRFRYSQFRLRKPVAGVGDVTLAVEIPGQKTRRGLRGLMERPRPADLVVYHFGRRGAGDDAWVVERWVEQFALKRRGVVEDRNVRIVEGMRPGGTYLLVEASGTYYYNVGPRFRVEAEFVPGARMLAVIVPTDKGPHYLKLTGREATVRAAEDGFRGAFGGDTGSEILLDAELRPLKAAVRVRFDLDGRPYPAEGVRVALGAQEAVSAAAGATFRDLEPGGRELRVAAIDGFKQVPPRTVDVEDRRTTEVVLTLERERS